MSNLDLRTEQRAGSEVKRGNDIEGPGFRVPGGDFARVLGIKPQDGPRQKGERMEGARVIEGALHRQFNQVGMGALNRYEAYRNLSKTVDGMRARSDDQFADQSLQAMKESVELGAEANMRYLEMQYQFQFMSQNHSCLSNLMKARHESVKKSLSEIR